MLPSEDDSGTQGSHSHSWGVVGFHVRCSGFPAQPFFLRFSAFPGLDVMFDVVIASPYR